MDHLTPRQRLAIALLSPTLAFLWLILEPNRAMAQGIQISSGKPIQSGLCETPFSPNAEPLLQVEGVLSPEEDATFEDGSLYDTYGLEGEAGQWITITLESVEFDPYVLIFDGAERRIGSQDDFAPGNLNASLSVSLPTTGSYQIFANAFDAQGRGRYTLTVRSGCQDPDWSEAVLIQIEANQRLTEGIEQFNTSQFPLALQSLNQALTQYRRIGDRRGESHALTNLGNVYQALSQYQQAIALYQETLQIARAIQDQRGEAIALGNVGIVYESLGQYRQAIEFYQDHLELARDLDDRDGESNALGNLGEAYAALGQYDQALQYHQDSLVLEQAIGDRQGEAYSLISLGEVYVALERYNQGIQAYQQALPILRAIQDRNAEAQALAGLGIAYQSSQDFSQAMQAYQEGLAIATAIGNRELEGWLFSLMGGWLEAQEQIELAIVFYKQSVEVRESIRQDLRPLQTDLQSSYTDTIAETYRTLASLLLQQDRVLEAQEVLDLLRVQELDEYLLDVRGTLSTAEGLDFWPVEQQILHGYIQWSQIEPAEAFSTFMHSPDIVALVEQLRRQSREQTLNPAQLQRLQDNLQQAGDAALFYPLILDDRLELVLVTPTGMTRRTVPIKREEVNRAIAQFRTVLVNRTSDPLPQAQQLYQWLIEPLEAELIQAQTQTLLYVADGPLRYIPLAAFHDGEQWLVQRFTINAITAASLTDFRTTDERPSLRVLAGAFSNPHQRYQFQVGENQFSFNGLPFAGLEIENIASLIPHTRELFDQEFSRAAVEAHLSDYTIVHLATHAEFVSGVPEESFIVFGNGDRLTLRDIATWSLPHVNLVVLSACKTAMSGSLGNGEEILGFGYQIQRTGAEAAIASLWQVNDEGSQVLMTAFYTAMAQGRGEAEALRWAQMALISREYTQLDRATEISPQLAPRINHPYYWAPFILIGNGL